MMNYTNSPRAIWDHILETLDKNLQFGFLEQARNVKEVRLENGTMTLVVNSKETAHFFLAEINQTRIMILARPLATISAIVVTTE